MLRIRDGGSRKATKRILLNEFFKMHKCNQWFRSYRCMHFKKGNNFQLDHMGERRRRISQIVAHRKYFFIFFVCFSYCTKKKLCPTIFISFIAFNKSLCHVAIPYGCCLSSFSSLSLHLVYFWPGPFILFLWISL